MAKKTSVDNSSWFDRWVSNNRLVSALVIVLLLLAVVFMLWKVNFIFQPIGDLFTAVGAPIIVAGVFYYILDPSVNDLIDRRGWKRTPAIVFVLLCITLIIAIIIAAVWPFIAGQFTSFINHWPKYWATWQDHLDTWLKMPFFSQFKGLINDTNKDLSVAVKHLANANIDWQAGFTGASHVFSTLTKVVLTLITFPFILFYMLRDGYKMPNFIAQYLPKKAQKSFKETLSEIDDQVARYVRGQLTVAVIVGVLFTVGYLIIGLPYASLVGFFGGLLNLIPFLGSFLAQIVPFMIALFISPKMVVAVVIVFVIEQTLESRVISPMVLGSSMKIHPITIIIVLLASGQMFGLLGVLFGIPIYAIAKVLVSHIYQWWRANASVFRDE